MMFYIYIVLLSSCLNSIWCDIFNNDENYIETSTVQSGVNVARQADATKKKVDCLINSCWGLKENRCVVKPKCYDLKCGYGVQIKFKKGVLNLDK